VRRSYERETTKGGHADAIPIAEALVPFLEEAIASSTSELVFPGPNGSMRSEEADPQKILRTALARAGLVDYWVTPAAAASVAESPRASATPRVSCAPVLAAA
jgi:hypothetical protein